jgi:hypothetical protein
MTKRRGRPLLRAGMVSGADPARKKLQQRRRQEYEQAAGAASAVAPAAASVAPAGGLSDAQLVGS